MHMSETSTHARDLVRLAVAGAAAPSLHNSQPWLFRPTVDGRGLRVYADRTRAVPLTDPDARAMYVSVGAAIFNLRVAAAASGRDPEVRLLPDAEDPDLLAVLDLDRPASAGDPSIADLYPAVDRRHSSREPFAGRDLPERVVGDLTAVARIEGADVSVLGESEARRVLALTAEAERRTGTDLARMAETRGWLRVEESAVDGIPIAALGPQDHDARVPVRDFASHPIAPAVPSRRFEPLPQVATLSTRGDAPADWLRAGQALERVWLLATLHGVRISVLHQAVEWPQTRRQLRDPDGGIGFVQLVLRMGYGPPGAATPRRPVEEVLARDEAEPGRP
jgi:hypothetical protein